MGFELRTYTAAPGKIGALLDRFRDHTMSLFAEHGMVSVGYWTKSDDADVLVYLLRHAGDPQQNWAEFRADPRWIEAKRASEADGALTSGITSVFLQPTDFSPLGGVDAPGAAAES